MPTIKLTNDVLVDSSSLLICMDDNNCLQDVTIPKNQAGETTIPYDCFLVVRSETAHNSLFINGVHWASGTTSWNNIEGDAIVYHRLFLKAGTVIKKYSYYGLNNANDGSLRYQLYGLR